MSSPPSTASSEAIITLPVTSLPAATYFYSTALSPLGYSVLAQPVQNPTNATSAITGAPATVNIGFPAIARIDLILVQSTQPASYQHKRLPRLVFSAPTRWHADEFFKHAVRAGGRDIFAGAVGKGPGGRGWEWEGGVRDGDGNRLQIRWWQNDAIENSEQKEIASYEEKGETRIELWRREVVSSCDEDDMSVFMDDLEPGDDIPSSRARHRCPQPRRETFPSQELNNDSPQFHIQQSSNTRTSVPPSPSPSPSPSSTTSSTASRPIPARSRPHHHRKSSTRRHSNQSNTSSTHFASALIGATAALALSYVLKSSTNDNHNNRKVNFNIDRDCNHNDNRGKEERLIRRRTTEDDGHGQRRRESNISRRDDMAPPHQHPLPSWQQQQRPTMKPTAETARYRSKTIPSATPLYPSRSNIHIAVTAGARDGRQQQQQQQPNPTWRSLGMGSSRRTTEPERRRVSSGELKDGERVWW